MSELSMLLFHAPVPPKPGTGRQNYLLKDDPDPPVRNCITCKEDKPKDDFYYSRGRRDSRCKTCHRDRRKTPNKQSVSLHNKVSEGKCSNGNDLAKPQ